MLPSNSWSPAALPCGKQTKTQSPDETERHREFLMMSVNLGAQYEPSEINGML